MTRPVFPFFANDISALARSLHNQLAGCPAAFRDTSNS